MRHATKVCLALALTFTLASNAAAQIGPGLLGNKSVQEELKVTEDQKEKVEALVKKMREKMRDRLQDLGVTEGNLREKQADLQKARAEINTETQLGAAEILSNDQMKRLMQIDLQRMGARAFTDAGVAKALKLTDDQKEAVKELTEEQQKAMRKVFEQYSGEFSKIREAITKLNKETTEKIEGKLTDDQKKAWKEMLGKPFEVKFERRQP